MQQSKLTHFLRKYPDFNKYAITVIVLPSSYRLYQEAKLRLSVSPNRYNRSI